MSDYRCVVTMQLTLTVPIRGAESADDAANYAVGMAEAELGLVRDPAAPESDIHIRYDEVDVTVEEVEA